MLEKQPITIEDEKTIWDDLGLNYLLRQIWLRKWVTLAIPLAWLIFSNIGFWLSGIAYSSEMLVVPASVSGDSYRSGSLNSMLGSFGVLGNTPSDQNFAIYLETWKSSWFAQQLLNDPALTREIFAGEWSEKDQRWEQPPSITRPLKAFIKQIFGGSPTPWQPPGTEEMLGFLQGTVSETSVRGEATTHIAITMKDPKLAEEILRFGHKSINAHLAQLFRTRADQNINYILNELNKVSVAEYRQALLATLTQVEHARMVSFSNPEFAALSLATYTTSAPVRPQASKIVIASLFLAVLFYLVLAIVADWLDAPCTTKELLASFKVFGRPRMNA